MDVRFLGMREVRYKVKSALYFSLNLSHDKKIWGKKKNLVSLLMKDSPKYVLSVFPC